MICWREGTRLRLGAKLGALLLGFALAACAGATDYGVPSAGISDGRVRQAFIPLRTRSFATFYSWGAGFVVTPTIAVSNAHNANLLPRETILATSRDYDLLFFRTDGVVVPQFAAPRDGENVIAYGQGGQGETREARGTIVASSQTLTRCQQCRPQHAIVFDAPAGPGFSGGPVVDAQSGAVLGVTFGYEHASDGTVLRMYAYDMGVVMAEMRALLPPPNPGPNR